MHFLGGGGAYMIVLYMYLCPEVEQDDVCICSPGDNPIALACQSSCQRPRILYHLLLIQLEMFRLSLSREREQREREREREVYIHVHEILIVTEICRYMYVEGLNQS